MARGAHHPGRRGRHRRIRREGGFLVAAGEDLHTLYEFQQWITVGALSVPEPDVADCGGCTVFRRKVCALAEAHNRPVTSHGMHELTVHALPAALNRTYMEAPGSWRRSSLAAGSPGDVDLGLLSGAAEVLPRTAR